MHGTLEQKQTLVDAILMLESAEIIDFNGHFSCRTDDGRHLMINSGKSVRSAVTVDDIVTIDFDGKLVEGDAVPPLEFHAHAAVYRHRPDVNAVVHCHPVWSTLFSMVDKPLQAVTMQAAVLGEIRYFAKIASINNKPLGDEVAAALGDQRVVSLKSHGAVVAAGNILETFALAYYLEENARRQYLAEQIGTPTTLSAEEVTRIGNTLWKPNLLRKVWEYEYAKLAARRPANDGTVQN